MVSEVYLQKGVTLVAVRATWQLTIERLVGPEHGRRKAIAEAAGMSPSQFSDLINRPERNPQIRQLQRIADALGVDLAALFLDGSEPLVSKEGNAGAPTAVASALSRDSEIIHRAIRAAVRDTIADILVGIGASLVDADESSATPRPQKAANGVVPPRAR